MLLYHVIINQLDKPGRLVIFKNLIEGELNKYFVSPLLLKKHIFYEGIALRTEQIISPNIICTNEKLELVLENENKRSRQEIDDMNGSSEYFTYIGLGSGIYDYEIESLGQSVTSEYLERKGSVISKENIIKIIQSNWAVTIGGGIVLALLICWLKIPH